MQLTKIPANFVFFFIYILLISSSLELFIVPEFLESVARKFEAWSALEMQDAIEKNLSKFCFVFYTQLVRPSLP